MVSLRAVLRCVALLLGVSSALAQQSTTNSLRLTNAAAVSGSITGATFLVVGPQERWPAGLVPIFAVGETNVQLRRLPPRGQESWTEPVFFAVPLTNEPHASAIAGRWECVATNRNGSRHEPQWEFAVDGTRVAGRFDQQGEYRVAVLNPGTFASNRLEFSAEWTGETYVIAGAQQAGRLQGTWQQHDGSDGGAWNAQRASIVSIQPAGMSLCELWEWRRGEQRIYSVSERLPSGWRRGDRPLCRVWQAP